MSSGNRAKISKSDGEGNLVVDCEGAESFEMVSELLSAEDLSLLRLKVANSCDPSDENQSKSSIFEADSVGVRLGKNGDTFSVFEARDEKVALLDAGRISAIFAVFGLENGLRVPPVRLVSDGPFAESLRRFAEQEGARWQVSNSESLKSSEISILFDKTGRCRFEFSDDFQQEVAKSKDVDLKNEVVLAERARLGASPVLLLFSSSRGGF